MGITVQTFLTWEDQGFAPKREQIGTHRLKRIRAEVLQVWIARRDADRVRLKKPWLRRPVGPSGELADNPFESAAELARQDGIAWAMARAHQEGKRYTPEQEAQLLAICRVAAETDPEEMQTPRMREMFAVAISRIERGLQ